MAKSSSKRFFPYFACLILTFWSFILPSDPTSSWNSPESRQDFWFHSSQIWVSSNHNCRASNIYIQLIHKSFLFLLYNFSWCKFETTFFHWGIPMKDHRWRYFSKMTEILEGHIHFGMIFNSNKSLFILRTWFILKIGISLPSTNKKYKNTESRSFPTINKTLYMLLI